METFGYLDELAMLEGTSNGNCYRYPFDMNGTYYSFPRQTLDLEHVYNCIVTIEYFLLNERYALAQKIGTSDEGEVREEIEMKDIEELPELLGDVDIEKSMEENEKYIKNMKDEV